MLSSNMRNAMLTARAFAMIPSIPGYVHAAEVGSENGSSTDPFRNADDPLLVVEQRQSSLI